MQLRELSVRNFRGIHYLDWRPDAAFCCLIGPGDSGKSTVLDAVEAALSSRWFSFSEPDFTGCNTAKSITIEATIGELSRALLSDERFGLHIRGWTTDGKLRDEPEDEDEPVLTIRLTVDATLEPAWELVCDRAERPRTLSNRDRALFGVVRLAGDDARHLAWGQNSVLSRLTGDTSETARKLAAAYRAAREIVGLDEVQALVDASASAEASAKSLGAYVHDGYGPALELGRSGLSAGAIALHDGQVPLRLAGLGTRRLATLAVQRSAITEGAIVLVDEIEHGLEPHRIVGAISQLKRSQKEATQANRPLGQILMTTHSEVALFEAGAESLRVVGRDEPLDLTDIRRAKSIEPLNILLRFTPRALFARRILVTEGNTEIGMLLGVRENWPPLHDGVPIEQLGAAIADGNGAQSPQIALILHDLGFTVAIFRDSDTDILEAEATKLRDAKIPVFEYGSNLNTEQALFSAAHDDEVDSLLSIAWDERGAGFTDNVVLKFPTLGGYDIGEHFSRWPVLETEGPEATRIGLADVFSKRKWLKEQRLGRLAAEAAWATVEKAPHSAFAKTLRAVEAWLYA